MQTGTAIRINEENADLFPVKKGAPNNSEAPFLPE
jgi:hypothetical protein